MQRVLSRRLLITGTPLFLTLQTAQAAEPILVKGTSLRASDYIRKAVASRRRPAEDVARDSRRKPAEIMTFFGVKPGMTVAELLSSDGYFTAILAEAVGNAGKVYGENNKWLRERFQDGQRPLANLIDKHGYTNIVELNTELEDPRLPDGLDAVFVMTSYHDFYWMGVDRAAMNKAVLKVLKPSGIYGIVDNHARLGAGTSDVNKNHRIERQVVVDDVTKAGFVLAEETDVLENPKDPLNVPVTQQELRGRIHQFALKFKKA